LGDGTGGATTFVKNGAATLIMTGTNTYTGQLQILQGTVQYGNLGAGGESSGVGHSVAISSGANLSFRHGATDVIAYNAPISGAGSVTMNSATGSLLSLSGANTYTGTTTLTAGTLAIGADSVGSVGSITSSAVGKGTLTFNGGALSSNGTTARTILNAVTFSNNASLGDATNNGKLTFSAAVALGTAVRTLTLASDAQFDGVISGGTGGGITKAGAGTLTLANVANTYTGVTTISGGVLSTGLLANSGTASGIGQASSSASNLVIDGGTLKYTGAAISNWNRPYTIGANGATFDLSSATGSLNIGGTIAYSGSGARSLTITTGASGGRLGNILADSGGATSLVKNGTGTLVISGVNTYTGQLQILQGTAQLGNAGLGGESSGVGHSVAISNGATLSFRHASIDAVTFTAPISGAGGVLFNYNNTGVGGGSLTLGGNNTFTGGLTISPSTGTVVLPLKAGSTTALGSGTVSIGQYGQLDLNGYSNTAGLLTSTNNAASVTNNGASEATLTLSAASGSQTYGGTISDGSKKVSITKDGAGSQTLSNTNTYTGDTTVSAGTLTITGSIANSAVTVNNSGTVLASGATGTIGKSVIVNSGAILAPGGQGSVGVATVGTLDLSFNSGSIFDWDITSSSTSSGFDKMSVGGTIDVSTTNTIFKVVLGGTALTDIQNTGNTFWNTPYGTQTWNMSTIFGESFASGYFSTVETSPLVSTYGSFTINGTALTWTAVPEPTSAFAGLLIGAGLLRRRRHV
jgi:fibronectin-binding autotransporter adhesin